MSHQQMLVNLGVSCKTHTIQVHKQTIHRRHGRNGRYFPKTLGTDTDLEARTESAVTSSTLHHSMQPCNPGMNRQQGEL